MLLTRKEKKNTAYKIVKNIVIVIGVISPQVNCILEEHATQILLDIPCFLALCKTDGNNIYSYNTGTNSWEIISHMATP